MYEEQSFEAIMRRCLSRVPATMDRREGSVIYDAIAPACAELAGLYTELDNMLDRAFPDTATGVDLDRKAAERSILRGKATFAVRKGVFTGATGGAFAVPLGSRFSGGGVNYRAMESIAPGVYKLVAETVGAVGNAHFGTLFPVDYLEGLAGAMLEDVLIPGDDTEGDESLRGRYFKSYGSQSFCGNVADYKERVGGMDGVGGVKVARTPSGGGTVALTLVDSLWNVPSAALVEAVQTAVDPVVNQGAGVGIAPIGHTVTVSAAVGRPIDVAFLLTLDPSVTWENVKAEVEKAIQAYFNELTMTWADSLALTVRISQIETRVLAVSGMLDVEGTTLNGAAGNVLLGSAEIPVIGSVSNGAV